MNSAVKLAITDYGYEALPIKTLYLSNLNNMSKENETLQKNENVNDFIRFFGYDPESLLEGVYGHKSDLKHILNEYEKWLVKKRSIPVVVSSEDVPAVRVRNYN